MLSCYALSKAMCSVLLIGLMAASQVSVASVRVPAVDEADMPSVIDTSHRERASGDIEGASSTGRPNDFFVVRAGLFSNHSKFLTYGWNGFAGGVVNWRYNDANRPPSIIATSALAVQQIQTEMGKWSAVCNVQFNYLGITANGPSLEPPAQTFDGINVIAWSAQGVGGQTGVTGVGASGPPDTLVEADIALNYQFNPNVGQTILHEVGHMIGIQHSNVAGAVMSGPPLTAYVSVGALQADDIAGCQALYGPPVVATRTISGAITNGGGVSGVTFCARPAAGVSCVASNGSGAYSCTVPNGWVGTLHSPSVSNNRIPPQTFSAVNANVTRNVTALTGIPSCNLDVDNNGLIEPATDGLAILRRMMGYSSTAFGGLAGNCAANTTSSAIFNATSSNYNVTGGAAALAATDGLVIVRAMSGRTGTSVTSGLGLANEPSATNTSWMDIQSWLNSTCGTNF